MVRSVWPILLMLPVITVPTTAQTPTTKPVDNRLEKAEAELEQKLELPFTLTAIERPLDSILDYVRHKYDVNISTNWVNLNSVAVDKDTLVTIQLENVTLREALSILTDDLTAQAGGERIDFRNRSGIIRLDLAIVLDRHVSIRVYNVSAVLTNLRHRRSFFSNLQLLPEPTPKPGEKNPALGLDHTQQDQDDEIFVEDVVEVVQNFVLIDSWGVNANVQAIRENLVISQTKEGHAKILALLRELGYDAPSRVMSVTILELSPRDATEVSDLLKGSPMIPASRLNELRKELTRRVPTALHSPAQQTHRLQFWEFVSRRSHAEDERSDFHAEMVAFEETEDSLKLSLAARLRHLLGPKDAVESDLATAKEINWVGEYDLELNGGLLLFERGVWPIEGEQSVTCLLITLESPDGASDETAKEAK